MQQENDPKHNSNITKDFIRGKTGWLPSQSPDLNLIEFNLHFIGVALELHG